MAWYDKQSSSKNINFVERARVPLLSLNEFGEETQMIIILRNFVNKP